MNVDFHGGSVADIGIRCKRPAEERSLRRKRRHDRIDGGTYNFDYENHLTEFNGGLVRYVNDGNGNRAAKITPIETVRYDAFFGSVLKSHLTRHCGILYDK